MTESRKPITAPRLRVVFMGTPDFACAALRAICEGADHDVVAVYSQPPRPKGRGQKVQKSPVQEYAEDRGIPVYTPKTLKNETEQTQFKNLAPDVAVVAAYGLILPRAVLDTPRFGCINIHASLLPRWRGASPIQHAIWAGDSETGVTLMQMDAGLDTGPEISKRAIAIFPETTAAALHDDLARLGAEMIVDALNALARTQKPLPSKPQGADYTYAPLLKKEDGRIDWNQSAAQIDRQIRALDPWPGVFTEAGGRRLKIRQAALVESTLGQGEMEPGRILNRQGDVVCGDGGVLRLRTVQPEGKNAMDFAGALNGGYLQVGDRLA